MTNTGNSNRKVGSKPSLLHYFSKTVPKRPKISSKPMNISSFTDIAMTPLPSSSTPFNPNLPPPSSTTPASVSSEESSTPSTGEITIESSSQSQQHDTLKFSSSDTPPSTDANGNSAQTPPTPLPTHELENDDVETPPSPDSQASLTPSTPPTPESEQPLQQRIITIRNRKRRQTQHVLTMDSNDEKETPQSLLDRHEDECTDNDDGGGRYHLQCQNKAVTTTPTPSVSRFDKKEKKSSTASTTLSVTSSLTLTSNKANKRSMYSNNIIKQSLKSSSVTSQPIQRKTKKKKTSSRQQQLFLDFGQTSFGKRTVCNICGMLRVLGVAEDDAQHDKICKDYKEGVTCLGWKNERIMEEFGGKTGSDRILEVREGDALQHRRKVLDVKRIVDSELGFAVSSGGRGHDDGLADNNEVAKEDSLNGLTSYLYVSNKRIVGLLLVKRIQRAYQVVVPNFKTNNNKNIKNNHDESSSLSFSISRSLKSSRALLGIHQIWVHSSHRNKGIASKLVTAARDHLIFGMMIPLELIAFSSPTMEGLRFAKSYVGVERPLVYDIN